MKAAENHRTNDFETARKQLHIVFGIQMTQPRQFYDDKTDLYEDFFYVDFSGIFSPLEVYQLQTRYEH